MDAHSVMDDWDVSRFDGGFSGLADLRDRGFSGAVEAGSSWLFLRDGEPLAVISDLSADPTLGEIDAFEGASGQRHEAETPEAATLAAMLALDGDVRGRYFTDDTSLATVHETLSGGGFTGYVELSENVLSGDYYYIYVDGEVDHLGLVGSSQTLSGEEAKSKAEGEVGIYDVVGVRLPDVDIPEPEPEPEPAPDPEPAAEPTAVADSSEASPDTEPGAAESDTASSGPDPPTTTVDDAPDGHAESPDATPGDESATAADDPTAADESSTEADSTEPTTADSAPDDPEAADTAPDRTTSPDAGPTEGPTESVQPDSDPDAVAEEPERDESQREPTGADAGAVSSRSRDDATDEPVASGPSGGASSTTSSEDTAGTADRGRTQQASTSKVKAARAGTANRPAERTDLSDVETWAVPSLDPEHSTIDTDDGDASDDPSTPAQTRTEPTRNGTTATDDRIQELKEQHATEIEGYEDQIESLQSDVETLEAEVESLEAEVESLRTERDRLEARVETLQSEGGDDAGAAGRSLAPSEALRQTSLFIREGTRGEATLEDAHDGAIDRETLESNLRIEYHTEFDDEAVTVEGDPFEAWLRSSAPYAFVEWLIVDLLFEIRSTGTAGGMRHLYDALPNVDRIGFDEAVETEAEESPAFDIVAYDRKGNPLCVANFDQRREPTGADRIEPVITAAADVCELEPTLAGAFAVTSSYFESDAMDAADEATSGSLLGRDKYRSYVKLSRKNGYHLCLVESRDESFNLALPEL